MLFFLPTNNAMKIPTLESPTNNARFYRTAVQNVSLIAQTLSVYLCVMTLFFLDMCQFFFFYKHIVYTLPAFYCAALAHLPRRVIVFTLCWIALASLYAYGLVGLHLLALIPVSFLAQYGQRFLCRTTLVPAIAVALFLLLDSLILWGLSLTYTPFKNFTIIKIFGTMIGVWLISLKMPTAGE